MEGLAWSGALDRYAKNRKQIVDAIPTYLAAIKKVKDAEKKLFTETNDKKKEDRKKRLDEAKGAVRSITFNSGICEDPKESLTNEHNLLGAYVGTQPIDLYKINGTDPIETALEGNAKHCKIAGVITDLRIKARKKDGAPLAFFRLTDKTGEIEVCCFTAAYERFKEMLSDDEVVIIEGNVDVKDDKIQFITKSIEVPEIDIPPIIVAVSDIDDWMENVRKICVLYVAEDGNPVLVYDEMMDEVRTSTMKVTNDLLDDTRVKARILK